MISVNVNERRQKIKLIKAVRDVIDQYPEYLDDEIKFICLVWSQYIEIDRWTIEDLMELHKIYCLPKPESIIVTKRTVLKNENIDKTKEIRTL